MLRSTVNRAARAAGHGASQQTQQKTHAETVVTQLTRQFSSSRFAVGSAMSKTQQESCYSRIAAKLEKSSHAVSMEAIDHTVAFLQQVGLSKSLALSAVAMHPMMTGYLTSTMEQKVDWLRANGIVGPLLVRAIARHPNILGVREEALLDVKEWYISQGVHPTKIPFLISVFPHAVSTSIQENLEPKKQFLVEQGLSHKQVVGVLQRCPQFMSLSLDRMELKVAFLEKHGLSSDAITKLIANTPEALGLSLDSMDDKLLALDEILGSREATAEAWSSNPRIIMCKSEQLKRSYKFLTSVVGMSHERIVKNVGLLMRSVDRIARPRYEYLEKHYLVDLDLAEKAYWLLLSDAAFTARFPEYEVFAATAVATRKKPKKAATVVTATTTGI